MNRLRFVVLLTCYVLALSIAASAQSAGTTPERKPDRIIDKCPVTLSDAALQYVQRASGTIASPADAANLITATVGTSQRVDVTVKDFYCIIHVLRWADPGAAGSGTNSGAGGNTGTAGGANSMAPSTAPSPSSNASPMPSSASSANTAASASTNSASSQRVATTNWYVFHGGDNSLKDFNTTGRLYGAKRIYFLLIHLNKQPDLDYRSMYEVRVEEVTPTQVANLLAAFNLFRTITSAANAAPQPPQNVYVADYMDQDYRTSKITVTPRIVKISRTTNATCAQATRPEDLCNCSVAEPEDLAASRVFENEGRSWWDISIGIPIKRSSQLDFDSTANVITAKKVDKQNVFAFLNLFYPKVDVKEGKFGWVPHFVGGISIAKQPLKKYFVGAGWGPRFAQFYFGLVRTEVQEPKTLMQGSTATPQQLDNDFRRVWKNSIGFGLNVSVKTVVNAIQKAAK